MAYPLLNTIDCGANGILGTGLAGCKIDRKRVVALGLLRKCFKFAQDPNFEYMRELQQDGILIMLQGVVSFADNTAEDTIITREGSGEKVVAGKMPYEYSATFDNGINFHKALTSLSSYKAYDLVLFDVDNTMFVTVAKDGSPKGFTLGMFENGKYTGSNGTDASAQTVTFQLINRIEFDLYASWYTNDTLDFLSSDLTGVNEVKVTVDPIVAGTSIVVSAFLLDGTHPVEGLVFGDFKVLKGGVANNPTVAVYNPDTKKYTLTVPSVISTDILEVSLNGIVLTAVDDLYKSNTVTVIVS